MRQLDTTMTTRSLLRPMGKSATMIIWRASDIAMREFALLARLHLRKIPSSASHGPLNAVFSSSQI
jgi:hypothetical protein